MIPSKWKWSLKRLKRSSAYIWWRLLWSWWYTMSLTTSDKIETKIKMLWCWVTMKMTRRSKSKWCFFSSSECWIRSLAISLSRSLAIRFPNTYATPILVSCHHYHRHQDHHHHRHPMQHLLSSSAKSGNIDHCHWLILLCNVNYDYSSHFIAREQCSKSLVGRL